MYRPVSYSILLICGVVLSSAIQTSEKFLEHANQSDYNLYVQLDDVSKKETADYNLNRLYSVKTWCNGIADNPDFPMPLDVLKLIFFEFQPLSVRLQNRLICKLLIDISLENEQSRKIQYWLKNSRSEVLGFDLFFRCNPSIIKKTRNIFQNPGPIFQQALTPEVVQFLFEKNALSDFSFLKSDEIARGVREIRHNQLCYVYNLQKIAGKLESITDKEKYEEGIYSSNFVDHLIFHPGSIEWHGKHVTEKPLQHNLLYDEFKEWQDAYEGHHAWNILYNIIDKSSTHLKRVTLCHLEKRVSYFGMNFNDHTLINNLLKLKELLTKRNICLSLDQDLIKTIEQTNNHPSTQIMQHIIQENNVCTPSSEMHKVFRAYFRNTKDSFIDDFVLHDLNNFYLANRKTLKHGATSLEIEDEIYRCCVIYELKRYRRSKNSSRLLDFFRRTCLQGTHTDAPRNIYLACSFLLSPILALTQSDKTLLFGITCVLGDICNLTSHRTELVHTLSKNPELLYELWRLVQLPQFTCSENPQYCSFFSHFFELNNILNTDEKILKVMNQIKDDLELCRVSKKCDPMYERRIIFYLLSQAKNSNILYNYAVKILKPVYFFRFLSSIPYDQQEELYGLKKDNFKAFFLKYCCKFILLPEIICHGSEAIFADIFSNEQIRIELQTPDNKKLHKFLLLKDVDEQRKLSVKCRLFRYIPYCSELIQEIANSDYPNCIKELTSKWPSFAMQIKATNDQIDQFILYNQAMMQKYAIDIVYDIIKLLKEKREIGDFDTICHIIGGVISESFCDRWINEYNLENFLNALYERLITEKFLQNKVSMELIANALSNIVCCVKKELPKNSESENLEEKKRYFLSLLMLYPAYTTPTLQRLFLEKVLAPLSTQFLIHLNEEISDYYQKEIPGNVLKNIQTNIKTRIDGRNKLAQYVFEALIRNLPTDINSLFTTVRRIAEKHDNVEDVKGIIIDILKKKSFHQLQQILVHSCAHIELAYKPKIEDIYLLCIFQTSRESYQAKIDFLNAKNKIFWHQIKPVVKVFFLFFSVLLLSKVKHLKQFFGPQNCCHRSLQ